MLISVPFIAATFLVYILLPELHNLHGNCMVCHLICLVIGYMLTAWVKLEGWNHVNPILCKLCGYFMYLSLLSAFLWSNVISFDLWRNFRYLKFINSAWQPPFILKTTQLKFPFYICRTMHMFRRISDKKKCRFYMLYAWGLSSLLTIGIYMLDLMRPFSSDALPGVGVKTCFLQSISSLPTTFSQIHLKLLSANIFSLWMW